MKSVIFIYMRIKIIAPSKILSRVSQLSQPGALPLRYGGSSRQSDNLMQCVHNIFLGTYQGIANLALYLLDNYNDFKICN